MPNQEYTFSNGLDLAKVLPALRPRLKWLSENATPSASSRYFDDGSFHAIVSEQLLRDSQPNAAITDLQFTAYKAAWKDGVIMRALNAVFEKEKVIEQTMLFATQQQRNITELPTRDFVGYEICVGPDNEHTLQVLNALFHFDVNTTLKMYVYAEGETNPFWESAALNITGGKYSSIELPQCIFSYSEKKVTRFYIGYKPSEITGGAMPYIDDVICPLLTCVFSAQSVHANFPLIQSNITYPVGRTGFNLEIKSFNDYTTKIVAAPSAWDQLLGLVNAAALMEQSVFAKRNNPTQRQASEPADKFAVQLELTGTLPITDAPQIFGIRSHIRKEAQNVRDSFIDLTTGVFSLS